MAASLDDLSFKLVIPSQTRYLNLVTNLARRASLAVGLDDATAAKVSIAVDEAVTNIILHAYQNDPNQIVEVELRFASGSLEIHLWHTGQGLREDQITLPDPNEYIRRPRKGGLGLLLMSRFMDEVHFLKNGDRNECCMIKRLE
ncbi:MAG: ATP-binding protein [Holophagales bacterium]|jgi:serine/threonine-protein kinase RsbW|nr:ATP-binding protein [Holophagales bacterium]